MPKYVRKYDGSFTGDTGGMVDWQMGFKDYAGGQGFAKSKNNFTDDDNSMFNFLGIGNKEKKKRQEVLAQVRQMYPPATSCADADQKLRACQQELANKEKDMQADPKASVPPRYAEAFNAIIPEFIDYINKNCLTTGNPNPPISTGTPGANNDPILITALPSVDTPPSQVGSQSNGSNQSNGSTVTPLTEMTKKIPAWVLWAGGGLIAATIIVLIVKKKS